MEVIAEINDLACLSIDNGDYQIALDVLNCCLGCVKQLKNHRTKMLDMNGEVGVNSADGRQNRTKESVDRLLKGAKRKIMKRIVRKTATTAASTVTRISGKKRKTVSSSFACPSQQSECPSSITATSCAVSTTTSAPNKDHGPNRQNHYHKLQNNFDEETEEQFFVYCKPLRMTKFQWSRVSNSLASKMKGEKKDQTNQNHIDREVELAVSSNLIFNIALTHHLIVWSREQKKEKRNLYWFDHDDSEDDVELYNENRHEFDSSHNCSSGTDSSDDDTASFSLPSKDRLRGALRLYKLGFRIHTKCVGYIMASETKGQSGSSSLSSVPTTVTPISATTTSTRVSPAWLTPLRSTNSRSAFSSSSNDTPASVQPLLSSSSSSPQSIRQRDRDDELSATTRFTLALLNNCAHIHRKLGDIEKSKIFLRRLLGFLLVIVDGRESLHNIVGDDLVVDGYLRNVYAATLFDKETAPAAVA